MHDIPSTEERTITVTRLKFDGWLDMTRESRQRLIEKLLGEAGSLESSQGVNENRPEEPPEAEDDEPEVEEDGSGGCGPEEFPKWLLDIVKKEVPDIVGSLDERVSN